MPRSTAGEGGTDKGFHCILIAPYPEMGAVFTPIARRMGCRLRVVVGFSFIGLFYRDIP